MGRYTYLAYFVVGGVSTVTGVYLSGLVVLLGSRAQVAYVLIGTLLGSVVFSALSVRVFRRLGPVYPALVATVVVGSLAYYAHSLPLVGAPELALLFLLACSPTLVVGGLLADAPQRAATALWATLAAGSMIFFLASVVAYSAEGYSGLPTIVLAVDGVGFAFLLVRLLQLHVAGGDATKGESTRSGESSGATKPHVHGVTLRCCHVYVVGPRRLNLRPRGRGAVSAAALLVSVMVSLSVLGAVAGALGGATTTPIKHVVFIMMENHSFDNMFGVYPTDNVSAPTGLVAQLSTPLNLLGIHPPQGLRAVPPGTYYTADPVEGYIAYHRDWAHGSMSGFLANSGPQSLFYYGSSQMGVEWDLAEEYSLGDMYFASQLSETSPNRLYSLAGYSPVVNDYGPPPYLPFSDSIFAELTEYGVSWAYYVMDPSDGVATLSYFEGMSHYSSHIQSWSQFLEELNNNSVPAVSWVMPIDGGAEGYSQGPPSSVLRGELWLLYIVNAIEQSPEWNTTAIFITYDEGGGYYDQVAPPVLDGVQLGQRVPLIVVSPYAKEDYVSNTVLTHTSLLAFVDYNWRLPALNSLVLHSNIPLDVFDFNQSYPQGYLARPPISFSGLGLPVPPSIYASSYPHPPSLAALFPLNPQVPFSSLPYPRTGESSFTLASVSSQVFVEHDGGYTPLYADPVLQATVYMAMLVLAWWLGKRGVP
jgi:phospholipase C